jgi:hypothetical protein
MEQWCNDNDWGKMKYWVINIVKLGCRRKEL